MSPGDNGKPARGKTAARPAAVLVLLALLAAATVGARLGDEGTGRVPAPAPLPPARLCAGIEVDGELLGLAFGDTWALLAASAVADLGLPPGCAPLVRAERERGALLIFASPAADGACETAGAGLLPAAARILCGAGLQINRDGARDLELLPGVGPVKSRALVESRERDGPFGGRDDLERVRGIGPRTAARIAPWLDDID